MQANIGKPWKRCVKTIMLWQSGAGIDWKFIP